jgi:large subunit ribosomal protein L21
VYAIIETGGRQYKVSPGDVIEVNRLPVEVGQTIDLDTVLMIGDGANTQIGQPRIAGATVRAKVADNFRSPKIIVFKYKPKVRYRRYNTHRQDLTRLVIKSINTGVAAEETAEEATPEPAEAAAPPAPTPVEVPVAIEVPAETETEVEAPTEAPEEAPAEAPVAGTSAT